MPAREYGRLAPIAVMQSDASASVPTALAPDRAARGRRGGSARGARVSGVEFAADTMDSGVCHMAHFADPDGNRLMFHHRCAQGRRADGRLEQRLHERRGLRALRERGTTRSKPASSAAGGVLLDVRVEARAAGRRRRRPGRCARRARRSGCPPAPRRPRRAGRARAPRRAGLLELRPEQEVRAQQRHASHAVAYCARRRFPLAHRLRTAPHLDDLHAPGARLAERQLAHDALGVQQRERAANGLRRGGG